MTVGGLLIGEAVPRPHLHSQQLHFADPDVELSTGGVGKGRNGLAQLLGRDADGLQFRKVTFLNGQKPLALGTGDLYYLYAWSSHGTGYGMDNRCLKGENRKNLPCHTGSGTFNRCFE